MKTVMITGHTYGLGAAIVNRFAELDDKFEVHGIVDKLPPTMNRSSLLWKRTYLCDISNSKRVEALAAEIDYPIDILINNAGVNYIDWMQNINVDDWDKVMNMACHKGASGELEGDQRHYCQCGEQCNECANDT
jgi:NAD(P)-dependent dehydrogenase (short-subunit alcohol dehydrogenase family)